MKIPDSGMPDEAYWNSLFDVPRIMRWLEPDKTAGPVVEVGCGYGTFTVPVAKVTAGTVYAFDVDPAMVETARTHAEESGLTNVTFTVRDVLEQGTGLQSGSAGMVLLFNILHFTGRRALLEEGARVLRPGGILAIIHWRKDIPTPRGPLVSLRPDKETILNEVHGLGLRFEGNSRILEPYHWGMRLVMS